MYSGHSPKGSNHLQLSLAKKKFLLKLVFKKLLLEQVPLTQYLKWLKQR